MSNGPVHVLAPGSWLARYGGANPAPEPKPITPPIGYLKVKEGESGYRVVGMCCATPADHGHASKVFRVNILPYSQHCCECGAELISGGSIRDLYDGT